MVLAPVLVDMVACCDSLCVMQQHSVAAMQHNRHLKVGALTDEQAAQRNADARVRGQKQRDLAKAAGLTYKAP